MPSLGKKGQELDSDRLKSHVATTLRAIHVSVRGSSSVQILTTGGASPHHTGRYFLVLPEWVDTHHIQIHGFWPESAFLSFICAVDINQSL